MHSTELLKHLLGMVKNAMMDPDDALFRTEFADAQTTAGRAPSASRPAKRRQETGRILGRP